MSASSSSSRVAYVCKVGDTEVRGKVDVPQPVHAPINAPDVIAAHNAARARVRADAAAPVSCTRLDRTRPAVNEDDEFVRRRMTPSCRAYNWDLSHVLSYDRWQCEYKGTGIVVDADGNRREVTRPGKRWSGKIATCVDPAHGADMSISDSTYHAVQRMAYHQAGGEEAELDVDQFVCNIQSLPL